MKRRDFLKTPALGALVPGIVGFEYAYLPHWSGGDTDDPNGKDTRFQQRLHQDFVTYVPGIEYFLLGNGSIQAVLQYAPDRSGERPQTFVGLTLMDAERFARKWSTFLFHPERGFERSMLMVVLDGKGFTANPETLREVHWKYPENVPTVSLRWTAGQCEIEEEFYVPSEGSLLFRVVNIKNGGGQPLDAKLGLALVPSFCLFDDINTDEKDRTVKARGFASMQLQCFEKNVSTAGRYDLNVALGNIPAGGSHRTTFVYSLEKKGSLLNETTADKLWKQTVRYWGTKDQMSSGNQDLDHIYAVARTGLRAHVSRTGKRDSGYWMYNMEWVRDDVMVVLGMLHAGLHDEAKSILAKILEHSVGVDGRTIESSRWFGFDYTEIDQNGELLYGLWAYLCWTGDEAFLKKYWTKIELVADFPLKDIFRDPTAGLLHNKREFWERSDSFGVEDGFELVYQFWVAIGLDKMAEVAERFGKAGASKRWRAAAAGLKKAMLDDPKFRFVEDGHLIKRRTHDGRWQQYFVPPNRSSMPPDSPIATEEKPASDPDSAETYPILHGMVDPKSELARKTLEWIDQLWNQRWNFGGYSRYNVSSEPDPPAPWPLAGVLMAQAYAEAGNSERVWRVIRWLITIHGGKSGGWFERYGPSITPPAPPVCVIGWTWAEITSFAVRHLMGVRPGLKSIVVRPIFLDGINELRGKIRLRGVEYDMTLHRGEQNPFAVVNGKRVELENGALVMKYQRTKKSVTIEMHSS